MFRRIVGGVMASALTVLGLASAAQAQTAHPARAAGAVPAGHVANLHQAYLQALPHVKTGKIAGISYAIGKRPTATAKSPKNACSEPNCPLIYNGGAVQHSPQVYLLLWGPTWSTDSGEQASASYLESFFQGLGVGPQDNWSTITSQYGDASGFPTFNGSVYMGVWQDTSSPPSGVDQNGLQAEADAFATAHNLTGNGDAQVIVATQSGTCPAGFYAPGCNGGSGYYCAWHSFSSNTGVTFTNLPYLLDAGYGCGQGFVNTPGVNDGWSIVEGHEYAETITDPGAGDGWYDYNDNVSGGEIGDKCAWGGQLWGGNDPSGNVTLSTGAFAMQSLWSNSANGCVMSGTPADTVTVTNPGSQTTNEGASVSLQIQATSSTGATLSYSAAGLPSGLSINSATGLITGKPTAPGTGNVTVTVTDTTGGSGSAGFSWTVQSTVVSGHITGYKNKCMQDFRARTSNGNKIDIWGCTSNRSETWTMGASKSLQVVGRCLTDPGNGRAGTRLVLEKCTGAKDQRWSHRSNGEWVVASHYLCLTDPHRSTRNGTWLVVAACRHTVTQRWSLP